MADESEAIAAFCAATGASTDKAREFLDASHFDVQQAAASYFAVQDEAAGSSDNGQNESAPQPGSSSAPAQHEPQAPSSSSASRKKPQEKKKFASLRDLQRGEEAAEDEDSDKDQEYFAGGDKSGLAVQDPSEGRSANDHMQRLLHMARRNAPRPPSPEHAPEPRASRFTGSGVTLGGDDQPSRVIPSAQPNAPARPPAMVERTLHLWNDGFSVDDGELYSYDNPANRRTLDMIYDGSAPLDLMGVEAGQAVDVKLEAHRGEDYVRPKKKYRAFEGAGQRLGADVPSAPATGSAAPTTAAPSASGNSADQIKPQVDDNQPVVTLQIRLADGTRLPTRFNTGSTIGDVYAFVERASANEGRRPYSLATTFPTKELHDRDLKLGDMPEFKRGGVVVQKWA